MAVIGRDWRMRPSVIDLTVVICFGLATAGVHEFRMSSRSNVQTTGCSGPMVSRSYSDFSSGATAGYCLVFDGSTLSPAALLRAQPRLRS